MVDFCRPGHIFNDHTGIGAFNVVSTLAIQRKLNVTGFWKAYHLHTNEIIILHPCGTK